MAIQYVVGLTGVSPVVSVPRTLSCFVNCAVLTCHISLKDFITMCLRLYIAGRDVNLGLSLPGTQNEPVIMNLMSWIVLFFVFFFLFYISRKLKHDSFEPSSQNAFKITAENHQWIKVLILNTCNKKDHRHTPSKRYTYLSLSSAKVAVGHRLSWGHIITNAAMDHGYSPHISPSFIIPLWPRPQLHHLSSLWLENGPILHARIIPYRPGTCVPSL